MTIDIFKDVRLHILWKFGIVCGPLEMSYQHKFGNSGRVGHRQSDQIG
jgi:hypothetical protein